MVRAYDPDRAIPRDDLTKLLNLAIRAPSAGHTQGREFLVLDDITSRDRFWSATTSGPPDRWQRGLRTAPVLILCFADKEAYLDRYAESDKGWQDRDENRWPVPYWDVDTGMAAMVLLLAAVDAGLGACFFGIPPERIPAVADAFDVPARLHPVGVVSLGHPAPDHRSPSLRRGRRQVEDCVRYGAFGPA